MFSVSEIKERNRLVKAILVVICGLLFACRADAINIHILFDDVQGLVEGDRVLAGSQQIGKVSKVIYTSEGNFMVDVAVAEQFKEKLTENARFYIVTDPDASERKAVEVAQADNPGKLLADGSVVQGTTRLEVMVNDLLTSMKKELDDLDKQLEGVLGGVRDVPKNEEIQRLRKQLQELAQRMKKAGREAKEKFEKELLPRIEEEIKRLRDKLKELGREEEVKPLEKGLNELKKI